MFGYGLGRAYAYTIPPSKCPTCKGKGEAPSQTETQVNATCEDCNGTGVYHYKQTRADLIFILIVKLCVLIPVGVVWWAAYHYGGK